MHLYEDFDIDEETRFSSVYRGKGVDDSGHDARDDILIDSRNSETFCGMVAPVIKKSSDLANGEGNDGAQLSPDSSVKVFHQWGYLLSRLGYNKCPFGDH